MPGIAFLTRGDQEWGLGHLHRVSWLCETLSGAGIKGLKLHVYCYRTEISESFSWHPACQVHLVPDPVGTVCARLPAPDVAVVDWLDSTPHDIGRLTRSAERIVLLDDYGPAYVHADLVINTLLAPLYPHDERRGTTRIISGADYIQLPTEAVKMRGVAISSARAMETELKAPLTLGAAGEPVRATMISFGGAPVPSAIAISLQAFRLAGYTGKLLVMPAPHDAFSLDKLKKSASGLDVDWLPASPGFHSILAGVNLAVLAGGLTLYEACFLGIPALCLALVEHQQKSALKLEKAGACLAGGIIDQLIPSEILPKLSQLLRDGKLRQRLATTGMRLLDGRGLQRTAEAILNELPVRH